MIDHEVVVDRLKSLGLFREVGDAADAASAMEPGRALGEGPIAYVVPMVDDPAPPEFPGGPQMVIMTFGVVLMVRRHGDAVGTLTIKRIKPLQDRVLDGLMGWTIANGFCPCWWRSGRLLDFKTAALWWLMEFSTRTRVSIPLS